jgi:hypothetical protein
MIQASVRNRVRDKGIPVLGIEPASWMPGEGAGHGPNDLLPVLQSLICCGVSTTSLRASDAHTFHVDLRCVALCPQGGTAA